jgi:hypothetical protein
MLARSARMIVSRSAARMLRGSSSSEPSAEEWCRDCSSTPFRSAEQESTALKIRSSPSTSAETCAIFCNALMLYSTTRWSSQPDSRVHTRCCQTRTTGAPADCQERINRGIRPSSIKAPHRDVKRVHHAATINQALPQKNAETEGQTCRTIGERCLVDSVS